MEARILVVEDEADLRQAIGEALSDAGFEVTATRTGDEAAILFADRDRFDLLLTDIHIPGVLDGLDLAELAREVHPGLPVIIVSGVVEDRGKADRQMHGLGEPWVFLPKPFDTNRLLRAVFGVLDPRSA